MPVEEIVNNLSLEDLIFIISTRIEYLKFASHKESTTCIKSQSIQLGSDILRLVENTSPNGNQRNELYTRLIRVLLYGRLIKAIEESGYSNKEELIKEVKNIYSQ
ncbi:hypothetical protein HYX17_05150 [Candidatus Woesearchaeota archaeon]|nr:hypothetical protein [Candidatus Woesearchaeota archaeon]